jgi:subtilisin-like proprotein convertase family protein
MSLAGAMAPAVSAATSTFSRVVSVAIPDDAYDGTMASMTKDTITASSIPASHYVTDITVTVAVDHTLVGDLTFKLRSPSGMILALVERPQGNGVSNSLGDDGSDTSIGDTTNLSSSFPISFSDAYGYDAETMGHILLDSHTICQHDFRCAFFPNPDQALVVGNSVANFAAFHGDLARGNWTLGIGDGRSGDVGTFVRWGITITHEAAKSDFASTPGFAIPDEAYNGTFASMTQDTIVASGIPAGRVVTDVTVQIAVDHTWVGDLTVKLRSPAGTILALLERPQGDANTNNVGDDGDNGPIGDSTNLISTSALSFNDSYGFDPESMGRGKPTTDSVCQDDGQCLFFPNPDQALVVGHSVASFAGFDGEPVNGNWTLGIGDGDWDDTGTFVAWGLTINHARPLDPCTDPPFLDVAVDHPFCKEIRWMSDVAISNGFDDGTYQPSNAVTREAMSAFLARVAGATPPACIDMPFIDVPIEHPFCKEIKWMSDQGISAGFDDGTYRPSIEVTRQAMSAFMARLAGVTPTPCIVPPFADVPFDHPFCAEIRWMSVAGISTGFGDGTYRPSIAVTRQAMSAFLYRVSTLIP